MLGCGTSSMSVPTPRGPYRYSQLLDNAFRFAPPGGSIDVSGRLVDGRTEATVADSGPGIPPEHLDRVFDRFYGAEVS
jgi:signal transduction histidine kinase